MKYEPLKFLKSDKTELFKSKDQPKFLSRNDLHDSKASISVDKNDFGYPNYVSSLYQTVKKFKHI